MHSLRVFSVQRVVTGLHLVSINLKHFRVLCSKILLLVFEFIHLAVDITSQIPITLVSLARVVICQKQLLTFS